MTSSSKKLLALILVSAVGLILLIIGLATPVPSNKLSFYLIDQYVGGDAYNMQIAASIRAGEISGLLISRSVYICSGLLIICISAINSLKFIGILNKEKPDIQVPIEQID